MLSALFVVATLWKPDPGGIPLCGFKMATGVSCPGCGMTRALAAIGRGEPAVSLKYHAFAPLVALGAAIAWVAMAVGLVTGRDILPDLNSRRLSVALIAVIVAFIAYWIFRLWTGTAP